MYVPKTVPIDFYYLPNGWIHAYVEYKYEICHISNQEEQRFTLRHKSDVPKYATDIYSMKAINMYFHFLTSDNSYAKGPVRNFK